MLHRNRTEDSDDDPGVRTMDAITSSAIQNFGGSLLKTFFALDNAQRRAIAVGTRILSPSRGQERRRVADWSWTAGSAGGRRAAFGLRL